MNRSIPAAAVFRSDLRRRCCTAQQQLISFLHQPRTQAAGKARSWLAMERFAVGIRPAYYCLRNNCLMVLLMWANLGLVLLDRDMNHLLVEFPHRLTS
jgi:hypothetical protein